MGRTIPVPAVLTLPSARHSIQLAASDMAICQNLLGCGDSDWRSIKTAFSFFSEARSLVPKYENFYDELVPYLETTRNPFDLHLGLARCKLEFRAIRVLNEKYGTIEDVLYAEVENLIGDIHRAVGAGDGSLRSGPVFTQPDRMGNRVQFPYFASVPELLLILQKYLHDNFSRYPALSAVVAFVALVHAHPFKDGNGRTARILFNLLLSRSLKSGHFLPISLIAALSDGGYILKLRRAMMGGEWSPLALFLADGFSLSGRMQKGMCH